ncbi:MAG: helix-turn-helix transcriptional regulator [Clostridia bacterium]|nr:helix-turn-helix transcriptional regulator [Clostridia bacterium]
MNCLINKRIYELRKEKNISQATLAKEVGVTQKAIDFWEKGINEPKASYVLRLAIFFGVSADYLLGLEN